MNKLLQFLDNHLLKFAVAFSILFITLYPKLPSIQITHTWVYVRLEDFVIAVLSVIWLFQLVRRKVSLPKFEGFIIVIYWIIGLLSLLYSLLIIGPHLANFFPKIAVLEYVRRIEYMILFFIGFSTIKNKKDIKDFIITLFITATGVVLYGFGQRFYQTLWHIFPKFFGQNPFCFPAFLTGNEEFAKGKPLCLDVSSRVASTFGGHYDLAANLVFIIPILIGIFLIVKKWYFKVLTAAIALCSIELLNFTSSRTSFAAYFVGVVGMLIIWKKKKWIIPVLLASVLISISFNNSVLQRFAKTVQQVKVVTINTSSNNLPVNLQNIIKKTKEQEENQTPQSPPPGTITTARNTATTSGSVTTVVTDAELKKLQEQDIAISTVSGSFLIQKAYALDISFTTRFQAEWPRDWKAFLTYPLLGQGYSTLTLASDNDYLRALGETGTLGFITFLFIFLIFGIYMKNAMKTIKDDITRAFIFGLAGGVIGLLMNAVLIDVFEASKVAEPLWLLLGIGMGGAGLYYKKAIDYRQELVNFFTSTTMLAVYLFVLVLLVFLPCISHFFVGDDFTWLHWAANSNFGDIKNYFFNSSGFFYRPLAKATMFGLYTLFSYQPEGYHLFNFLLHFLIAFGVYQLARKIISNKFFSFLAASLFIILPANAENVYWISTISTNLSTFFIVYMLLAFWNYRIKKSLSSYLLSIILGALALLSYEGAIILPLLIFTIDLLANSWKIARKQWLQYVPFALLSVVYIIIHKTVHAVDIGGDYAYNLLHVIPNFIGNFFGYIGLFLFGQQFVPLYTMSRLVLKTSSLLMVVIAIFVFIILFLFGYNKRKTLTTLLAYKFTQIILFNLLFIFIALLPFLGLGNLAPRYGYLAAIGFSILVAYLLFEIKIRYQKDKNKIIVYSLAGFLTIVMLANYLFGLREQNQEWQHAGEITAHTLKFFRIHYQNIAPDATLYFVNLPIKYKNAWVFPVGLSDGLWIGYQSNTLKTVIVSTTSEAVKQKSLHNSSAYIFTFDKRDQISEVK